MVEFRGYEDGDVYAVKIRLGDPLGAPVVEYPGVKWTMTVNGEPAAVAGIMNGGPGIGMLWAFVSDDARGHGKKIVKFIRPKLDFAFKEMRYHRLQAIVRVDRPEYQRFIELLGFEKEGLMKKAAFNQDDLWLYARVN